MPQGVEHYYFSDDDIAASPAQPLMPQGVEHLQDRALLRDKAAAQPLMPQGVEHLMFAAAPTGTLTCPTTDAARR